MIEHSVNRTTVAALRQALPYLHLYRGKTFVVKTGGEVFEDTAALKRLFEQIGVLHHLGIRCVMVHGGGPQLDRLTAALGLEKRSVGGRRITDPATLACAVKVFNGELNTRAIALCREIRLPAVGLCGADGNIVVARKRPPRSIDGEVIDFGEVGDIVTVDPRLVLVQIEAGFLPVVSPLAADAEGRLLNVNADGIAAALACALRADKLIMTTSVPGVLENPDNDRSLISYTDLGGLEKLIRTGAVTGGMLPKLAAIEQAIRGGVPRVHVISWRHPDSLLGEIFTNEGSGTLVVEKLDAIRAELTRETEGDL